MFKRSILKLRKSSGEDGMLEKSISRRFEELPYLIRLLDDDSPAIRETVISRLLELGVYLEEELELQGIQLTPDQRRLLDTHLKPLLEEKTLEKRVQEKSFFSPGTLVQHKKYSYRGVIVALDRYCLAPDSWYLKNKTQPKKNQPWYHVFVHESDAITYAAQSSLKLDLKRIEIAHPLIPFFFSEFSNGEYIRNARNWGT